MPSDEPVPILPLSDQTASLLRATHQLPSLPATLSFLLLHLLELVEEPATAVQQVSVTLDPSRWGFRIHVDVDGLAADEYDRLAAGHGLGLVGRVALLELDGRDQQGVQRSCIVKGGRVLHNGPSLTASRTTGSTLTVKDLFYNVPVRRLSAPSSATLQARCLRLVEQLSLARFQLAFRVWEAGKEDPLLRTRKADSAQERFGQLHGSALLKTPSPIAASFPPLSLTGFISLSATHSRTTEYLAVNGRPLAPSATSQLYALVDGAFAGSSFSERAQAATESGLSAASPAHVERGAANARSPRKAVRRPVYALELRLPPAEVVWEGGEGDGVEFEDWPKVKRFVEPVIRAFLEQNGFLRSTASSAAASPEKRRLIFDPSPTSSGGSTPVKKRRLEGSRSKRSSAPSAPTAPDPDDMSYRDPTTKKVFKVDRVTGTSRVLGELRAASTDADDDDGPPAWLKDVLATWENPTFPPAAEPGIPSTSAPRPPRPDASDLPFHAVSSLSTSGRAFSAGETHTALRSAQIVAQVDSKFVACLLPLPRPSSTLGGDSDDRRRLLFLVDQHAADERIRVERFLRELGSGFLANCRSGDAPDDSQRLGGIKLVEPQAESFILLTAAEYRSLVSSPAAQLALARWGITLDLPPPDALKQPTDEADVQTRIVALPAVVADRLLGRKHLKEGPGELTELVKSFLARLDEEGGAKAVCQAASRSATAAADGEADWLGAMRFCPKEILDLVDSKACRGAIMFNDRLSVRQCDDLIRRLAQTRLPLQCAHGRPSLVLVADLDALHARSRRREAGRSAIDWRGLGAVPT